MQPYGTRQHLTVMASSNPAVTTAAPSGKNLGAVSVQAKPAGPLSYRFRMLLIGVWAAIVTFFVFLVSLVTWGHTLSGWLYARGLNSLGMRILGIKVKVSGGENLPQEPAVLLVNHQSNFDAFFLGKLYPWKTVVVAKKEMLKVPLFGTILKASRNIIVDREDSADAKKAIKDAVNAIKKDKNNIWIFPEGTRSHGKGLGEFKKGAFAMAIAAQAPIVPIINQPMEHVLDTTHKTLRRGVHRVKVLPAIETKGMKFRDIDALLKRVEDLFQQELLVFSVES
jgi:1-acyl-sn-glycerol-3-phosphate acyltransferase